MQRFPSIEYLRGVAIILMIQVHFVENLAPREVGSAWLYDFSTFLGSFPAPLFTFVSGLSYCLWARKQESARRRDSDITAIALRRGLFLFVVGIAFNFAAWLPEETFNWDILTLIGTALLLLAYARKLPLPILVLVGAMVLLASPVLRVVGDYDAYWDDGAYTYDFNFRDIVFGFVANGYFPVFPWILFPLVGFVCGDLIFQSRKPAFGWLYAAGIALLAVAGAGAVARAWLSGAVGERFVDRISEFPASTLYVVAMVGACVLGILVLHRLFDRASETADGWFAASLKRFSSFSLTVYVLHHLVILWPVWIYGAWAGHDDVTHYWRQALSAPLAFGLALSFILACHFALGTLDRHRRFSLEAMMRRLCD